MNDPVYSIPDNPSYHEQIRKIQNTDPVNAETIVNPVIEKALENTQFVKKQQEAHTAKKDNPHSVTKAQVGLGNADNTSDADKPISTAMQNALNGKADSSHGIHVSYSSAAPKMDGTASVGTAATVARSDHVHPSDTGKANASHTHTKSNITDFPTSLPASDVYSWAKASSKPSYSWSEISSKPSTFSPSSHNHDAGNINSGTLSSDRLPEYVKNHSNPNLLDNWYFADFIDQRGKSKEILNDVLERIYQSAGVPMSNYWVCDRWRYQCLSNANHVMYFNDKYRYKGVPVPYFSGLLNDGLHMLFEKERQLEKDCWYTLSVFGIVATISSVKYPDIDTYVDSSGAAYNYMPVLRTASVYIDANGSGGYFKYNTFSGSAPPMSYDLTRPFIEPGTVNEYIGFIADNAVYPVLAWYPSYTTARNSLAVIAIKLEKGQKQTLVTNNSDGRMILNDPPPNKASELLKCQRYYFKTTTSNYYSGSLYTNNAGVFLIPVPVQMRVNPSVNILRNGDTHYNGMGCGVKNVTSKTALADSNAIKLVLAFEQAFTGIGQAVLADWDFEFSAEF